MTYVEMNYWRRQAQYRQQFAEMRYGMGIDYGNIRYRGQGETVIVDPLPPEHWSSVLGILPTATDSEINAAYRKLARSAHPDAGGSDAAMAKLNAARDAALKGRN